MHLAIIIIIIIIIWLQVRSVFEHPGRSPRLLGCYESEITPHVHSIQSHKINRLIYFLFKPISTMRYSCSLSMRFVSHYVHYVFRSVDLILSAKIERNHSENLFSISSQISS